MTVSQKVTKVNNTDLFIQLYPIKSFSVDIKFS